MKFTFSQQSIDFEIPDEWLNETGANNFKPVSAAYCATLNEEYPTELKPIIELQAPIRNEGVAWFKKDRMVSLINGVLNGEAIPPIEAHLKPGENKLRVKDGFHRFYMSVALGFEKIPVSLRPYYDINEL